MTNTRALAMTFGAAVFVLFLGLAAGQGTLTAAATGQLGSTTLQPGSQGNVSAMSTAGIASNVSKGATTNSPTTSAANATAPIVLRPDGLSIPIMIVVLLFLVFCFVGGTVAWWLARRRYYRQLSQKPDATEYENKGKKAKFQSSPSIEETQEEEVARALNEGTALFTGREVAS